MLSPRSAPGDAAGKGAPLSRAAHSRAVRGLVAGTLVAGPLAVLTAVPARADTTLFDRPLDIQIDLGGSTEEPAGLLPPPDNGLGSGPVGGPGTGQGGGLLDELEDFGRGLAEQIPAPPPAPANPAPGAGGGSGAGTGGGGGQAPAPQPAALPAPAPAPA
ncbi:MAG: hypothetical protein IRZ08_19715, partial [Frankia sp.]|nr:hypothetical protein [Frankia sp.]